jgi:hypothetical protein
MYRLKNSARRLLGGRLYGEIRRRLAGRASIKVDYGRPIADPIASNEMVRSLVSQGTAAAIGKVGASELRAILEYLAVNQGLRERVRRSVIDELHIASGVFPRTQDALLRFAGHFVDVVGQMDLLVAWSRPGEGAVFERYCPNAKLVSMRGLDPFYVDQPWTAALANKRVLVASPFVHSISQQYQRRHLVWRDRPAMLPEFDLTLLPLPFSDALVKSRFDDWFQALAGLIADLHSRRFDVLLVGGGAFSLPLVVAAKEMGSSGIHLGGSTQILFGIRGGRWDGHPRISAFFNEHWVRPSPAETPRNYRQLEAGAYW